MLNKSDLKNIAVICFLIFIPLLNYGIVAQEKESDINIFSPGNRLKFGNMLFNEKDYLRANGEFKEYLKNYNNDTVQFKFAESFFRIGRLEEAAANYKIIFFYSDISSLAKMGYYKSVFFQNNFEQFREQVKINEYIPDEFRSEIIRLNFISHLLDDSILPDSNKFYSAFDDSNKTAVKNFYNLKKNPPLKNITKAALLSAALPGLGKIYTGQIGDAITAFVSTGLLTFMAVDNFNNNHKFKGWLFTGLAALSYAGNIYGSAASAQIFNANFRMNFDKEVKIYFGERNFLLPKVDLQK